MPDLSFRRPLLFVLLLALASCVAPVGGGAAAGRVERAKVSSSDEVGLGACSGSHVVASNGTTLRYVRGSEGPVVPCSCTASRRTGYAPTAATSVWGSVKSSV